MRLRLLDLDGSLMAQPLFREAVAAGRAQRVDLRDQAAALRLWASRSQLQSLENLLAALPPPPGDGPQVTFTGSGDYHHLTVAILAAGLLPQAAGPVTVVHFDNHPDWVRWPPAYHCGSWVNRILELPQVRRVITLGPTANDLERPQFKGGNLRALAQGRIELYPWRHAPSRVLGRFPSGNGHYRDGKQLVWRNLVEENWDRFLEELAARLPTDAVWITIDKDVLRPDDALTNWDQGEMPLSALTRALRRIARDKRVIGIDICGEYAPPHFDSPWKRLSARLDHPPAPAGTPDLARNERTNRALLDTLREIAA